MDVRTVTARATATAGISAALPQWGQKRLHLRFSTVFPLTLCAIQIYLLTYKAKRQSTIRQNHAINDDRNNVSLHRPGQVGTHVVPYAYLTSGFGSCLWVCGLYRNGGGHSEMHSPLSMKCRQAYSETMQTADYQQHFHCRWCNKCTYLIEILKIQRTS